MSSLESVRDPTLDSVHRKITPDDIIVLAPPADTPQDDDMASNPTMILGQWLAGNKVCPGCPQNKRVELMLQVDNQAIVSWRDTEGNFFLAVYEIILVDPRGNC